MMFTVSMEWSEVVNSAIEAGAVVSVQSEGRVFCYSDGKLIATVFFN
jgi:hypothetical protein